MYQQLQTILAVGLLSAQAASQGFITTTSSSTTVPDYSAIYTTTHPDPSPPDVETTVIVTLPITGSAISRILIPSLPMQSLVTNTLIWAFVATTPLPSPPTPTGMINTVLTSSFTSSTHHQTTVVGAWVGASRRDYWSTRNVTFIETVDEKYPTTIARTGITTMEATLSAVPLTFPPLGIAGTGTYSEETTVTYRITTVYSLLE
jgi:phage terminase large subunit-like protein